MTSAQQAIFDAAYLIGRVGLAAVFVFSGIDKGRNYRGAVEEMKHFNLPVPALMAAGVIALHLVAGLALVFDIATAASASTLAIFTLIATLMAHGFWKQSGERFTRELTTFLEHIGIICGLLLIAALAYLRV